MKVTRWDIMFTISLVMAIWFVITGIIWYYLINVFISFPFGLLSWLLYRNGKKNDPNLTRYKTISGVLTFGVITSLLALLLIMIFG